MEPSGELSQQRGSLRSLAQLAVYPSPRAAALGEQQRAGGHAAQAQQAGGAHFGGQAEGGEGQEGLHAAAVSGR